MAENSVISVTKRSETICFSHRAEVRGDHAITTICRETMSILTPMAIGISPRMVVAGSQEDRPQALGAGFHCGLYVTQAGFGAPQVVGVDQDDVVR